MKTIFYLHYYFILLPYISFYTYLLTNYQFINYTYNKQTIYYYTINQINYLTLQKLLFPLYLSNHAIKSNLIKQIKIITL